MCGQLLRIIDLIDQSAQRKSFIAVANLIALTVSQQRVLESSVKIEILSIYATMNNDRNLQFDELGNLHADRTTVCFEP